MASKIDILVKGSKLFLAHSRYSSKTPFKKKTTANFNFSPSKGYYMGNMGHIIETKSLPCRLFGIDVFELFETFSHL